MFKSKYGLISLLLGFFILILIYSLNLHYDARADRPPYPKVKIGDPTNDWSLFKSAGNQFSAALPNGRHIYLGREAISTAECKIRDPMDVGKSLFPFPDISGVSYLSDGKTLNSTIWLSDEVDPSLFLNYSDIFQIDSDTVMDVQTLK
jgi:hypothetical protein